MATSCDRGGDPCSRLVVQEERTERLREVLSVQLIQSREALALQAREYERRLHDLNGEADRLREMQGQFVKKDVYELGHREVTTRQEWLLKIVYLGLGALMMIEFALKYLLR
jgi:hypothetical protein